MWSDSGAKLPPLQEAVYPRVVPERKRTLGFYAVFILCALVWSVTPLSYAYLAWYIYIGRTLAGYQSILYIALAAWAAVEAVFGIYYQYLSRRIQPPAPPSDIASDELSDIYLRVLHAGLTTASDGSAKADRELAKVKAKFERRAKEREEEAEAKREEIEALANGNPPPLRKRGRLDSGKVPTVSAFLDDDDEEDPLFDNNGEPRILDTQDPRAVEFREQLRTWFHHKSWEEIRREDVRSWLAWSCFNMPLENVKSEPKKQRFLDRTYTMLQARTGTQFPEGRSDIEIMRLTLDPVNVVSRPFIIYAIANSINWFLRTKLYPSRGVGLYREGNIDYFVRIPPGWTPEKALSERNSIPILYMHGLGFGLFQNHLLVKHLIHSLPTHPILLPLANHTAQEIFNPRHLKPWTRRELVDMVRKVCVKWGFWTPEGGGRMARGGVSMMSHSNGSVHHGWVLKDAPELVRRSTFVDPVVFSLWEGDVCFNFCYRKPRAALELLLYYFVASEPGIANYIQRHFNWCDNTLFIEDIPNATTPHMAAYFLGGRDIIIDAARTRKYLEKNGVTSGLHWDEHAGHGDGLLGESRDRVVMYVGTGSTRGWEGWLTRGRRAHSVGGFDRPLTPYTSESEGEGRASSNGAMLAPSRLGMSRRKTESSSTLCRPDSPAFDILGSIAEAKGK